MTEILEDTPMEVKHQKLAEKHAARVAADKKTKAMVAAAELDDLNKVLDVCGLKDAVKRSAFVASQGLSSPKDFLFCAPEDGIEMVKTHNCNASPDTLVGYIVGTRLRSFISWARLQERLWEVPHLVSWCASTP